MLHWLWSARALVVAADAAIVAAGLKRSPQWDSVRKAHLEKEPACQVCGTRENVAVHHKKPFHLFPALELVDSNLISLCNGSRNEGGCHFRFGHLWEWASFNPDIDVDAAIWRRKKLTRPGKEPD
jgi:hypothetical protein